MKQKQYSPLSIGEMAVSLFAVNEGFLDDVDVKKITSAEAALHSYMHSEHQALLDKINATGQYDAEIEEGLRKAVAEFKANAAY
jgi:F-type H+-transporting ATPase subunit alpha